MSVSKFSRSEGAHAVERGSPVGSGLRPSNPAEGDLLSVSKCEREREPCLASGGDFVHGVAGRQLCQGILLTKGRGRPLSRAEKFL